MTIICLRIEPQSERHTYYTKCYKSRDYTFANRIYYAVQYCMTWSCTSGSLTAMYTEAYVRRNNKQLCNRLKFLFQPSIVFSQSIICIAFYQAKEMTGSVRFTYFVLLLVISETAVICCQNSQL
jgi:hypothetical protein